MNRALLLASAVLVASSAAAVAGTPTSAIANSSAVAPKLTKAHKAEAGLAVPEDEARIVSFDKPVTTVFVADPSVADINVIDSTHAFLLGKAFGETNLIALDAQGNPISSRHITVYGGSSLVTLNRGNAQFTYACASVRCEFASAPGDVHDQYDNNMEEKERREIDGAKSASVVPGR